MGRCAPNALLVHHKTPTKGAPNSTTKQHEIEPTPCFTDTFSSMRAPDDDYPHSPFIDVLNHRIPEGGIWPGMCPVAGLPGPYSTHTHAAQAGKTAVGQDPLAVPCLGKIQHGASLVGNFLEWPKLQDSRSVKEEDEDQSNKPLWQTTFVIFQCEGCGGCCYDWPHSNVFRT